MDMFISLYSINNDIKQLILTYCYCSICNGICKNLFHLKLKCNHCSVFQKCYIPHYYYHYITHSVFTYSSPQSEIKTGLNSKYNYCVLCQSCSSLIDTVISHNNYLNLNTDDDFNDDLYELVEKKLIVNQNDINIYMNFTNSFKNLLS